MKIEEIQAFPLRIPFRKPAGIAFCEFHFCESILVKVKADSFVGYGEALTDPVFTGETMASVLDAIKNYLGPAILQANPFSLRQVHRKMDQALVGNTAAKAAIDMACLDVAGNAIGESAYNLLGGDFNSQICEVPEILFGPLEEVVKVCEEATSRGVKCLKVKVGEDPIRDLEKVRRIRETVGHDIEIRLDANQGWHDHWAASRIIRHMEKYDIALIEQPLLANDLEGSAMLRETTEIPIMLDESVHSVNDALSAMHLNACDIISVKVMKVGGLMRAKELIDLCSIHGMPCHMGTSWETEIGWAANLSLIRALPGIKLWDAYSPTEIYWGMNVNIGSPIRSLLKQGVRIVECPEGPGFGTSIDDNAVAKHLVAESVQLKAS